MLGRAVALCAANTPHMVFQTRLPDPADHPAELAGRQTRFADPLSAESMTEALEDVHTVVHLVGAPVTPGADAAHYAAVDGQAFDALEEAVMATEVAHVVFVSAPLAGWPFGATKAWRAQKNRLEQRVKKLSMHWTVLRLPLIAGDVHFTARDPLAQKAALYGGLANTPMGTVFGELRPMGATVLGRVLHHMLTHPDGELPRQAVRTGGRIWRYARAHGLYAHTPSVGAPVEPSAG